MRAVEKFIRSDEEWFSELPKNKQENLLKNSEQENLCDSYKTYAEKMMKKHIKNTYSTTEYFEVGAYGEKLRTVRTEFVYDKIRKDYNYVAQLMVDFLQEWLAAKKNIRVYPPAVIQGATFYNDENELGERLTETGYVNPLVTNNWTALHMVPFEKTQTLKTLKEELQTKDKPAPFRMLVLAMVFALAALFCGWFARYGMRVIPKELVSGVGLLSLLGKSALSFCSFFAIPIGIMCGIGAIIFVGYAVREVVWRPHSRSKQRERAEELFSFIEEYLDPTLRLIRFGVLWEKYEIKFRGYNELPCMEKKWEECLDYWNEYVELYDHLQEDKVKKRGFWK